MACHSAEKDPAENAVPVTMEVIHFEDRFFSIDSVQFQKGIQAIYQDFPSFSEDYFKRILMLDPLQNKEELLAFYKAYLPVYKDVKKVNAAEMATSQLQQAFKRFHFYFPEYEMPKKIIYFIGPLETYGNILTKEGIAIGLQLYLGANAAWYYSEKINSIYPTYISNQFTPAHIVVNSTQNMLNDYYSFNHTGNSILHQMISFGKQQYILKKCIPFAADTLLLGYTQQQLAAIEDAEKTIWNFILKNKMLYSVDPIDARNILSEGPYNEYFGTDIPSNVGKYIGMKIVQKWMEKQPSKDSTSLKKLLGENAKNILAESNYAP